MREYIVYRHGGEVSNAEESPVDRDKRPVARLFAGDPSEACRLAQEPLAEGQWLSAEPAEEVDAKVQKIELTQESLGEAENP